MRHLKEEPVKKGGKKKGKVIVIVVLSVFIAGFIFGAYMLFTTLQNAAREQATFDSLVRLVEDTDETQPTGELRKYDELYKKNPDFFGWLKIEDTKIDYPVMYTPRDSEYYLHRDFNGDYSYSGMLFIDGDCPEKGNYYLIYGHHMNNGSMFGELPKYADKKYYEEHKTVFFDTRYELRDYEVFAAFYAKAYPKGEEEGFCYYTYKDLTSPEVFDEYVSNVKAISVYDTGITPVYGDELIAMSTCNYHTADGRFVVVARRIKDAPKQN